MSQDLATEIVLPFERQGRLDHPVGHPGWARARQTVLEALAAGWTAAVVGASGTGKTLFLWELARTLRAGGIRVEISTGSGPVGPTGSGIVRLVDDADELDGATIDEIFARGGPTVFAVRPPSTRWLVELPERIAFAHLEPLAPAQVEEFVIACAGSGALPFAAGAIAALTDSSAGLPRLLHELTQASQAHARRCGASCVEARHVEAVQAEHIGAAAMTMAAPYDFGPAQPVSGALAVQPAAPRLVPSGRRRRLSALLVALPVAFVVLLGVIRLTPSPNQGAPPAAPSTMASGAEADIMPAEGGPPAEVAAAAPPVAPVSPPPVPAVPEGRAAPPSTAAESRPRNAAAAPIDVGTFRGTTFNETLGRGGALTLSVSRVRQGDEVLVSFEAYGGLIGRGQLTGRLTSDGRLVASGTLMMGRNPFYTELQGTIVGQALVGTARYSRAGDAATQAGGTRGSFRLTRMAG